MALNVDTGMLDCDCQAAIEENFRRLAESPEVFPYYSVWEDGDTAKVAGKVTITPIPGTKLCVLAVKDEPLYATDSSVGLATQLVIDFVSNPYKPDGAYYYTHEYWAELKIQGASGSRKATGKVSLSGGDQNKMSIDILTSSITLAEGEVIDSLSMSPCLYIYGDEEPT